MAQALIVMGVAGSGKTTVGRALAHALDWPFHDADDYHPQANIDKMAQGVPLDDSDRRPWLERLHKLITSSLQSGDSLVLACSALKESYRAALRQPGVRFIYLQGSEALIRERLESRQGHYMKPEMLRSQFATLEEPKNALTVSVDASVADILERILSELKMT